jgi:hypothetical protein
MHNLKDMSHAEFVLVSCSIRPEGKADSGTWKLSCIRAALVSCRCMFWDGSTGDPSHGLAIVDDEGACEQERRTVTTYYMNLDMRCVLLPEEFLGPCKGGFVELPGRSRAFSVACIALNPCMHERKVGESPGF